MQGRARQTPLSLRIIFWILAAVFLLLPFHAFLSTWAGTHFGLLPVWKAWKEILVVGAALVLVVWLTLDIHRWRELFRQPLIVAAAVYTALVLVISLLNILYLKPVALVGGLTMTLRYVLVGVVGFSVGYFAPELWQRYHRPLLRSFLAVSAVVALFGLWQVTAMPADFMKQFGYEKGVTIAPLSLINENEPIRRAFGTLRGPNEFGAFMIMPLVLSILVVRRPWKKYILVALFSAALVASSSRSAWLGLLVGLTILLATAVWGKKKLSKRVLYVVAGSTATLVTFAVAAVMMIPEMRLHLLHSSPNDTSLTQGSTGDHISATVASAQRILQNPFGCGAGCAGPASFYNEAPRIAENYYLQVAEEYGVIGLGAWCVLFGIVLSNLWRFRAKDVTALWLFVSGVAIFVAGFFLHIWSDDPLSMTWWLLAGTVVGVYVSGEKRGILDEK